MPNKPCPHCDPLPASSVHFNERVEVFCDSMIAYAERMTPKFFMRIIDRFSFIVHRILFMRLLPKLLREKTIDNSWSQYIYNRSHVIIEEARARKLPIYALSFFGLRTHLLSMYTPCGKIIFEELPTLRIDDERHCDLSDKGFFKKMLLAMNAPFAEGETFESSTKAVDYGKKLGFPLVVKPATGSLSKHTFCDIRSIDALRDAVASAKKISRYVLVERYVPGHVFRVTIVDGKIVGVAMRERPNIIGDGIHTIHDLIEMKNASPLRGNLSQKNTTLHKIPITMSTYSLLTQQGVTLESIPDQGQKIVLHEKVILACGADIHDVTDAIHPDTRELLKKIAEECRVSLIGFDVIACDISLPPQDQSFAVLEANTKPFIDMHHFPVSGEPRNVAGALFDYIAPYEKAGA